MMPVSQTVSQTARLEYLGQSHFMASFGFAAVLHLMVFLGWSLLPPVRVIDIPVHAMNIRLGNSDAMQFQDEGIAPQPMTDNSAQLEAAMSKLIRKSESEKIVKKEPVQHVNKPVVPPISKLDSVIPTISDKIDSPRQFVRPVDDKKIDKQDGSVLGNSNDSKAEIKARYEQTISLWIQKFKLYPEKARELGMQGSTVVRIRIDRRGNIRYSALEGHTGYPELDRAALDMVRRANPVPAVPDTYPAGDMFEYLIPVNFGIK